MKTTHTPGPWTTWLGDPANYHFHNRRLIVPLMGESQAPIAQLPESVAGDYYQSEANARLIAAAPELLAALEALLLEKTVLGHLGIATEQARAAIAKAKQ